MHGFVVWNASAADPLDHLPHDREASAWPPARPVAIQDHDHAQHVEPTSLRSDRLKSRIRRPLSPICPFPISELPAHTFWQRPWVQNIVPLVSSIIVHGTILALGVIGYRAAIVPVRNHIVVEGSISSAPAPIGARGSLSGFPDVPERIDDHVQATTSSQRVEPYDPHTAAPSDEIALASLSRWNEGDVPATPIMLGMGASALAEKPNFGPSRSVAGDAIASRGARSNDAAFFGVSGNARSVVYVCDASASMIGSDEAIVFQLQRAVLALHPSQSFNVIFFSGKVAPMMLNKDRLVPADPDNKLAAIAFARRYTCKGATPSLPAIRAALAYRPEMLNFVTDGEMEDADNVVAHVREMNRDKQTKFNVILVTAAARVDQQVYHSLKLLAEESGGTCRIVAPFAQ